MKRIMMDLEDNYSPYNLSDYDKFYSESESIDSEVFSEMRSNVLLKSGEHYNKRRLNLFRKLRDFSEISNEHKLRITKNHIQNICKIYSNNILSMSPGVGFRPKNEKEIQDQKDAELHKKLWIDAKQAYSLDEKIDEWCDSFVDIGEVAVKVFFDPDHAISGKRFVFESIYGFNLLRPIECKDIRESRWLCIRKMVDLDDTKAVFGTTEVKRRMIISSMDETFKVFDAQKSTYRDSGKELLLKEFYFKPCSKYPKGWYAFVVKGGILEQGPLPYGVFPIALTHFDRAPTAPRGIAPIRTMRPYQVEINRCSSKIAETQTTLGDDKLVLQNGAKFTAVASYPGVRAFGATGGAAPVVIAGRDGAQFVPHLQNTIGELYQVMNVAEDAAEKDQNGQMDPYALLFRSAKQKKKFQRYVGRFQRFLIDVSRIYLSLAKYSLSDEEMINILGRDEIDNLPEIRAKTDLGYEIIIEGANDDIETMMGRQFMINHALQYVGTQLDPDDIGKLLKNSPFGNFEDTFSSMTLDSDNLQNDILALDRGDRPPVHMMDNHVKMSKGLKFRTTKPDFKYLPDIVRQNYESKIALHDKFEAFNQLQLQRAKQGYIPTDGYMVVCDLYVPKPDDPTKTQRVRLPYSSLQWLIKQLESQNMGLKELEQMDSSQQQGIIDQMNAISAMQGNAAVA
jgi:hypothetical protein